MFSQNNSSSNLPSAKLQALMLKAVRQFAQKKHYQLSSTEERLFVQKISDKVLPQWKILAAQKQNANPLTLFLVLTKRSLKEVGDQINNHFDRQLLENQASHLVTKYQPLVAYLTATITSGNIDYEEVIQAVNEKFLRKIHTGKLGTQYKGNATIRTFLNMVVRNLVIDYLRAIKNKNRKNVDVEINPDITPEVGFDMSLLVHNPVFQEHLKRLEDTLKLFKKRSRFEFCLKVMYRLLLTASSIRRDYPDCSDDLLVEILSVFVKDYTHLSQGKLYQILYRFVSQLERLHSKGSVDSLRKWFDRHREVVWQQIFDSDLQNLGKDEKRMKDWYFEMLVYHYYA
ncbi:MAG: sigma-70 family RNA polymerase sigma factor [Chitinophagales bacterium]